MMGIKHFFSVFIETEGSYGHNIAKIVQFIGLRDADLTLDAKFTVIHPFLVLSFIEALSHLW